MPEWIATIKWKSHDPATAWILAARGTGLLCAGVALSSCDANRVLINSPAHRIRGSRRAVFRRAKVPPFACLSSTFLRLTHFAVFDIDPNDYTALQTFNLTQFLKALHCSMNLIILQDQHIVLTCCHSPKGLAATLT